MAVTPDDLLAPSGPVEAELFPDEGDGLVGTDLYERLESYIAQAVTKITDSGVVLADPDPATTAWALHLTFQAAYIGFLARPASDNTYVSVLGAESHAKDQRDALKALADLYAQEYEGIIIEVPVENATPRGVPSRTVPLEFEW